MEAEDFLTNFQHQLEEKLAESHRNQLAKSKEKGEEDGKVIGEMEPGGLRPKCEPKLKHHGFNLPAAMFMKRES